MRVFYMRDISMRYSGGTPTLDQYEQVTEIEGDNPNVAFGRCQNIDEAWREPPCRSMMVGDLVQTSAGWFRCSSIGWTEIPTPEAR